MLLAPSLAGAARSAIPAGPQTPWRPAARPGRRSAGPGWWNRNRWLIGSHVPSSG